MLPRKDPRENPNSLLYKSSAPPSHPPPSSLLHCISLLRLLDLSRMSLLHVIASSTLISCRSWKLPLISFTALSQLLHNFLFYLLLVSFIGSPTPILIFLYLESFDCPDMSMETHFNIIPNFPTSLFLVNFSCSNNIYLQILLVLLSLTFRGWTA